MYVRRATIHNARVIADLDWDLQERDDVSGWHVLLGDNGSGKTTVLRCIALALLGPDALGVLRESRAEWVRYGERSGFAQVFIELDDTFDPLTNVVDAAKPLFTKIVFGEPDEDLEDTSSPRRNFSAKRGAQSAASTHGVGETGWFSSAFGPFRRFTGEDEEVRELFRNYPRIARHLTLFGDRYALSAPIPWLLRVDNKALRANVQEAPNQHPDAVFRDRLWQFINQEDFLPHGTRLSTVTADGEVLFIDGNGARVELTALSDGFRSVLGMALELLRQLADCYGVEALFPDESPTRIELPGVVLIDEVDVHLHPTWQRDIGYWFQRYFPRMQFIVATHSPIVCHAAARRGSVFRLPAPGTDDAGELLAGEVLDRLLYGDVLDAYGTGVFGRDVTRSSEGRERQQRLAELNTVSKTHRFLRSS